MGGISCIFSVSATSYGVESASRKSFEQRPFKSLYGKLTTNTGTHPRRRFCGAHRRHRAGAEAGPGRVRREITLVNRENFFLFTPMLHEVAASDLDLTTIVNPARKMRPSCRFDMI